jgi:hypothetical protein
MGLATCSAESTALTDWRLDKNKYPMLRVAYSQIMGIPFHPGFRGAGPDTPTSKARRRTAARPPTAWSSLPSGSNLRKTIHDLKIPVIDLDVFLMAHREWWNADAHYSQDGYKAMAKAVADTIREHAMDLHNLQKSRR